MKTMLVLQAVAQTTEQTISSPLTAFFLIGVLMVGGLCVGLGLAWIYARMSKKA